MPEASPPPPHGTMIRGGAPAKLLHDLEPAVPCPATIAGSSKLGTTVAPVSSADSRGDRFAAFGAAVVEDDLRALAARAVDLHLRRIGRHDDDRANAEPPGRDRHAARMIAGRESDDAALALLRVELQQPVGRAPQLEGAAGLQALALQPDRRAVDLALDRAASARPARRSAAPLPRTSLRLTSALIAKWLIFHPFD